jgi:hypothetical protein
VTPDERRTVVLHEVGDELTPLVKRAASLLSLLLQTERRHREEVAIGRALWLEDVLSLIQRRQREPTVSEP